MELLLVTLMLSAVVAIIAGPLRRDGDARTRALSEMAAVEAARDAKYQEILDTELDFHTGKLSEPDYRTIDHALRGEAIELVRRLDTEHSKDERG